MMKIPPNKITFLFLLVALALAATAQAAGDKWALLIGVDKCKAVGELKVCSADAVAMKSVLEQIGYPAKRINVLTDNQSDMDDMPTMLNVERAIKRLAEAAEADDTVLFFFSGHGVTANGTSMLVPTDGDLTKGISLTWIKDQFAACKAREKVMILDACHSGAAKGVSGITPDLKTSGNLIMLLSCEKDQVSWPDAEGRHSVFTSAVLEGLSGKAADADKKVTHLSLADYVRKSVKNWTFENKKSRQTPIMVADASGDIVLADVALINPVGVAAVPIKPAVVAAAAVAPKANALANGKWSAAGASAYALSRKERFPILVLIFATGIDQADTEPVLKMMDDSKIAETSKGWLSMVKVDLSSVSSMTDEDKQFARQLAQSNKIDKFPVLLVLNGSYQADYQYGTAELKDGVDGFVSALKNVKGKTKQ
jgi:hypothetical protein